MPIDLLVLGAAFLTGLLGTVHCGAMCGGIAVALGSNGPPTQARQRAFASNLGRVLGYTVAGAIAGGFGAQLLAVFGAEHLGPLLRTAVGIALIWAALRMASPRLALRLPGGAGTRLWQWMAPLRSAVPADGPLRPWLLGLLWGWLPCGLSYTLLTAAWLEASALHGALLMFAFGLGTLPLMVSLGYSGARLMGAFSRKGVRYTAASVVATSGLLTLLAPWLMHLPAVHAGLSALGCRSITV